MGINVSKAPANLLQVGTKYYFRLTVPKDLRGKLKRTEYRLSLHTCDKRRARNKVSALSSMLWYIFGMLRKDNGKMTNLPDDQIRALVNQWIKNTLDEDDKWKIGRDTPIPEGEKEAIQIALSDMAEEATGAIGSLYWKTVNYINSDIENILNDNKLKLSPTSEDILKLRFEMLKVATPLFKVLSDRLDGNYDPEMERALFLTSTTSGLCPTQTQQYLNQSTELKKKLSEVMDEYVASKNSTGRWTIKSKSENIRILTLLLEMTGDPRLEEITKAMLTDVNNNLRKIPKRRSMDVRYKDHTLKEVLSMDIPETDLLDIITLNSHVTAFNGLLSWVEKQYSMHPWISKTIQKNIMPKSRKTNASKLPFSDNDLRLIFSDPHYVTCEPQIPRQKHLRFHEFWLPLLGLFTGARTEELCQLYLSDFDNIQGVPCISITELDDKGHKVKHTKSESSERVIPIHPQLIELGLWDLANRMKTNGYTRLFEGLEPKGSEGKYGAQYSQWFSRKLESIGVINKRGKDKKSFYSFRHTFINYCEQNRFDLGLYERISGHSIGKSMGQKHYAMDIYPQTLLKEVIERIKFDVDLSHLKNHKFTVSPDEKVELFNHLSSTSVNHVLVEK